MQETRWQVSDFEIFGVGAQRKKRWLDREVELLRHDWGFLPGVEEHTLEWLKPQKISYKTMPPRGPILAETAQRIFSLGHEVLGDTASKIFSDYRQELPWEDGLVDDHFRYFSAFLKNRFALAAEVCQWEWVRHALSYQDFSGLARPLTSGRVIRTAPGMQILELNLAAEAVKKPAGLYALTYSQNKNDVVEMQLTSMDAEILDLLEDDRETTAEQILHVLSEGNHDRQKIIQAHLDLLLAQEILLGAQSSESL